MPSGEINPMIVAILAAFAIAGLIFAFLFPYVSGEREKDKRVQGVASGKGARRMGGQQQNEAASSRKKSVADSLKEIESRQKAKEKVTLRLQLQRAGLEATPRDFYIASLICGILCGAGVYLGTTAPPLGVVVAAFVGTMGLPRWFLGRMVRRRQNKFLAEMANSIDVIVRGVKSGLPLNECLGVIARESPEPIAGEIREVVDQQRLGVPLGECLERMCERVPLAEVRFLTIVISIQQQAGGNLSEALGNLSGVLRDRLRLQMKVKALSAEAKASAMVLGSLPPCVMFMVYMTTPSYISLLFTTLPGKFMLGVGACWMSIGLIVMRKMINFKF
jgi:tight adherence protein B